MANPSYYEQLKHPKWQKKGCRCANWPASNARTAVQASARCMSTTPTTRRGSHHGTTRTRASIVYARTVTKEAQNRQTLLQRQIGRLDLSDVDVLIGYAMGLESRSYPMVPLDVFSYEVALGVGDAWGLTAEQVIEPLEEGRIDGYKLDELAKARRGGSTGGQEALP